MKKYSGIKQSGFTLIEIMIVMVISFFVILGIYGVFDAQNQAAVRNESSMDLNSTTNTSFNILVRQVRMAGYRVPLASALNPINNFNVAGGFAPATGFHGGTLPTPLTAQFKSGTDGLLIISADNRCKSGNYIDNSLPVYNSASATTRLCEPNCFTAAAGSAYVVNDVAIVSSTKGDVLVRITSITTGQTASGVCSGGLYTTVGYADLDEMNLATYYNCLSTDPCVNQSMTRLETALLYYVNTSNQLMRMPIAAAFNPELVADGVEDMQFQFDSKIGCNSICGGACTGCDAPATYPSPLTPFVDLRGVRIGMVLRTLKQDKTAYLNKGIPINLFDHIPSPSADSYHRRAITELIQVKNLQMQDF